MKKSKVFWGIFFILAAIYVVVSKLGLLPDVGVFKIILTVFLLWLTVEGIRNVNFYSILFPIAFICIIYDKPLGIEALTPWTVLSAALLGSIGLSMIFKGSHKKCIGVNMEYGGGGTSSEQCTGEQIRIDNSFGSAIRYVNSDNFQNAHLDNSFGSLSVYFDNAIIQSGSAFVNIDNSFGQVNVYIPKEWRVQMNLERSFGSINERGSNIGSSETILYLNGETSFGEISIYYV